MVSSSMETALNLQKAIETNYVHIPIYKIKKVSRKKIKTNYEDIWITENL